MLLSIARLPLERSCSGEQNAKASGALIRDVLQGLELFCKNSPLFRNSSGEFRSARDSILNMPTDDVRNLMKKQKLHRIEDQLSMTRASFVIRRWIRSTSITAEEIYV